MLGSNSLNTSDLSISMLLWWWVLPCSLTWTSQTYYLPFDTPSEGELLASRQLASLGSILDYQCGIPGQTVHTWVTTLGLWPSPNTFQLCGPGEASPSPTLTSLPATSVYSTRPSGSWAHPFPFLTLSLSLTRPSTLTEDKNTSKDLKIDSGGETFLLFFFNVQQKHSAYTYTQCICGLRMIEE